MQLFGNIKKGMKATIVPEQPTGCKYTAQDVIVDRVIDAANDTFGIRLRLYNKKYKLSAGSRCEVTFPALE